MIIKPKKKCVVDKSEIIINNDGTIQPIAFKGRMIKVIEISEMNRKFLNHQYSKETLMTIHEAEWKSIGLEYCGG